MGFILVGSVRLELPELISKAWAILQILSIRVGDVLIDTSQILTFILKLDLMPEVNLAFTLNLVGVLLLFLFIRWGKTNTK